MIRVLKYYDLTKKLFIECDVSGVGVGFALPLNFVVDMEDDTDESLLTTEYLTQLLPIEFGSQTFTECERRYANIERDLSDHKPLLSIILKNIINAPPRLQRMLLRLQKYNVTLVYHKGSEIVFADHLSGNLIWTLRLVILGKLLS